MKTLACLVLSMFVVVGCESEVADTGGSGGAGGEDTGGGGQGGLGGEGGVGNQGGEGGLGGEGGGGNQGGEGGVGGEGGGTQTGCELHNQITLSAPLLEAGDNGWQPGEAATFSVMMATPIDNFDYPGIEVTASSPLITPNPATNTLFGIFATEPATVQVGLTADASLTAGMVVTLTATVVSLDGPCGPDAPTLTFDVTLQ